MTDAGVAKTHPAKRAALLAAAWLIDYFAARAALEWLTLPVWGRVAIALAPVPLFAAFLYVWVHVLRAMDELERRIHLEALAIAFALTALMLTTLALMQRAVSLSFEDWSFAHVWIYLPIFYFGAVAAIARRYGHE
jgi:hypothetical protein